jgi:hypothetical protein
MKPFLLAIIITAVSSTVVATPLPLLPYHNSLVRQIELGMTIEQVEKIAGEKLALKPVPNPRRFVGVLKVEGVPVAVGYFNHARVLNRIELSVPSSLTREDALNALSKVAISNDLDNSEAVYKYHHMSRTEVELVQACFAKGKSVTFLFPKEYDRPDRSSKYTWIFRAHDRKEGVCWRD